MELKSWLSGEIIHNGGSDCNSNYVTTKIVMMMAVMIITLPL